MKILVVVLVIGAGVFYWQSKSRTAAPAAAEEQAKAAATSATPQPISEHNWAKRSLDRTHAATDQVAKTHKDNEQP